MPVIVFIDGIQKAPELLDEIHYLIEKYKGLFFHVYHWRSSHGAEVDLIVEKENVLFAIEIKSTSIVKSHNLTGLKSFVIDYPDVIPLCVTNADRPYMAGNFPVIPWQMVFGSKWLDL